MTEREEYVVLSDALGDAFDDRELSDGLARIERRLRRRKVTRRMGVGALASVGVLALVALFRGSGEPEAPVARGPAEAQGSSARAPGDTGDEGLGRPELAPLRMSDGRPLGALGDERLLAFADGSRARLDPEALLRSRPAPADEVRLVLDRGHVRFDIHPGGPRRWTIEAGPVRVQVLGTAFTVTRELDSVQVEVHRGLVSVTTASDTRRLRAGERLGVGPPDTSAETRTDAHPGADQPARRRAALADLVERADAARAAGDVGRAVELLQTIVRSYPRSLEAPAAAITWARLEERRGDPAAAERAYQQGISLRPPTALLSLSYDRLIRLQMARGAQVEAAEALARFRALAPESDRLPSLERLVQ